jgi:hypothetical protein
MTDGTLDTTGPQPAVRLERHLPDPPAVVWQAITERDQLKAWFPCDVIVSGAQLRAGWVARNAAGWDDCLDRLAGLPAQPDAWRRRFTAYAAAFEPVIGPQEGPPAEYKGEVSAD